MSIDPNYTPNTTIIAHLLSIQNKLKELTDSIDRLQTRIFELEDFCKDKVFGEDE